MTDLNSERSEMTKVLSQVGRDNDSSLERNHPKLLNYVQDFLFQLRAFAWISLQMLLSIRLGIQG